MIGEPGTCQSCPNRYDTVQQLRGPLLTKDELEFMDLSAELANLFSSIVGHGPSRDGDLREGVDKIHQLQHTVMAQAAARAFPERFRLLGSTIR